jgi:multiple sugar transport system ATP-binding protein
MASVAFQQVSKIYPDGTRAVADLNLKIDDGQLMVLVGPSGCGKSTALRLLAGLEDITEGEILVDGRVINETRPQERNIAMVFQNYALYPHMTIRGNLEFPLKMMKLSKHQMDARVREAASLLGLTELMDRRPRELSGGQRQRVAMGRAIVRNPVVFLMDEPLSNLDAKLRIQIRSDIAALQKRMGTTTIYVTHDQLEAMTLGDRVAVLRKGKLQQVASPQELYDNPSNTFVATFIGNPGMNIFESTLRHRADGKLYMDFGQESLPMDASVLKQHKQVKSCVDKPLLVGFRPEAFSLQEDSAECSHIQVTVTSVEPLGHETLVYCDMPAKASNKENMAQQRNSADRKTTIKLVARLTGHKAIKPGDSLKLKVAMRQVYLFDENGKQRGTPLSS